MINRGRQPNQRLKAARLRTPSPSGSGIAMSRAELAEAVNAWLWRQTEQVYVMDANHVGKYELGETRWPSRHYRDALCAVLGVASPYELGFHPPRHGRPFVGSRPEAAEDSAGAVEVGASIEPAAGWFAQRDRDVSLSLGVSFGTRTGATRAFTDLAIWLSGALAPGNEEVDLMRRRTFVSGLAALGALAPLASESARHGLHATFAADHARMDLDEWGAIVAEYGARYYDTPPAELATGLHTDLVAVQVAAGSASDDRTGRGLCRAAAMLAALHAMTVGNLGDVPGALRWWRTAGQLADRTGDAATIGWVRGMEVVRALYERRPLAGVLDLVRRVEAAAAAAPPAARMDLISGKAQVLAMVGRRGEAEAALGQLHDVFGRLPAAVATDHHSTFGCPPECVLHTESYVYSYLGDLAKADAAQRAAIRAYPADNRRQPAQIELQRAICLIKNGDATESVAHARRVLGGLPPADRIRPVVDLGQRVLDAVPAGSRDRPDVAEYRELLAAVPAA